MKFGQSTLWSSFIPLLISGLSLFMLSLVGLSSCSTSHQTILRTPSSVESEAPGCVSLLAPILKEGDIYSSEDITADALAANGHLNLEDYDEFSQSDYWRQVVAREGQSQRDEELGLITLSLIKKKNPRLSDEAIKDNYKVLLHFCGQ